MANLDIQIKRKQGGTVDILNPKTTASNVSISSGGNIPSSATDMQKLAESLGSTAFTSLSNATTESDGLMSSTDKTKLNGIATGANNYSHPTTSGNKHIPSGGSSGQILRWSADGTAEWGNDNNTTYSAATQSADGLMSSTDKTKLDGIATGATANIGTVTQVKVGSTAYNPSSGIVSLPDYPTTLPASDVSSWAKASTKPSYTASEVGAIASTTKGAVNGVAELDANGKVPSSQLPSFVDDVLEYTAKSSFPTTGETGKIYVDTTTNLTYRWSGSAYVEISPSLALGTTSSTAYRGDRGNTAYSHATDSSRLTTAQSSGLYKIATTAEGHVASVTAVEKADITVLGIPGSDTNTHRPIQVNGTQVLGDNTTALNLKAGSNVSLSNSSGTVTIAATDTTYSAATQSADGLMSATDKTKLDGIATGANNYSHPTTSGNKHIPSGGSSGQILRWSADGTATWGSDNNTWTAMVGATSSANGSVGYVNAVPPKDGYNTKYLRADGTWQVPPDNNTTYSAATQSTAGLMSASDKTKLDGIATGAEVNSITGVKGNSESSYRTGNVNLTAANVGAAASSHTHGNIQNGGTLQTNDITIANGDKLVVTDSSDSSKIARTSVSFDGSTATKCLTQKGTFESFNNYSHPSDGANTGSFGDSSNQTPTYGGTFKVPYLTVNSKGHVTAISEHTVKIPASDNTDTHRPIQVNGTQILANNTTTALNLKAGSNVTITNSSGTVTIAATDTTYSAATTSANGLMSSADKTKMNGIGNVALLVYVSATPDDEDPNYSV